MSGPVPPPPPFPGARPPETPTYLAYSPTPTSSGGQGYWVGAGAPDGQTTIRAVGEIRKGIHYYRIYLVISLLTLVGSAGATLLTGIPQGTGVSIPTSVWYGNNTTASGAPSSGSLATAAGIGVLAIILVVVALVVLLIGFLAWRRGVKQLETAAFEYGGLHVVQANAAMKDYARTVILWITQFVTTIVAGGILTFTILSRTIQFTPTGGASRVAIDYAELRREVIIGVVVIGVIAWVFGFLVYFFASRSLNESIYGLGTTTQREGLDGARQFILVGAALGIAGSLSLVYAPLGLLGVVPLLLLLYGYTRLVGAYDSWLASPVRPAPSTQPR